MINVPGGGVSTEHGRLNWEGNLQLEMVNHLLLQQQPVM
jgi:hypothetical protein